MTTNKTKTIKPIYVEPADYFPKDVREKYFGEKKTKLPKKKTTKKPKKK